MEASPGLRDDENGGEAGDSGEACPRHMNGGGKGQAGKWAQLCGGGKPGQGSPLPPAALIRRDSEEKETVGALFQFISTCALGREQRKDTLSL